MPHPEVWAPSTHRLTHCGNLWQDAARMTSTPKIRSRFGEQLRVELDRQGLSIRQLSRRLDPAKPEQARRALGRWIAGTKPTEASKRAVAVALGLDENTFADPDDGESDQLVADAACLFANLLNRLRALEAQVGGARA